MVLAVVGAFVLWRVAFRMGVIGRGLVRSFPFFGIAATHTHGGGGIAYVSK